MLHIQNKYFYTRARCARSKCTSSTKQYQRRWCDLLMYIISRWSRVRQAKRLFPHIVNYNSFSFFLCASDLSVAFTLLFFFIIINFTLYSCAQRILFCAIAELHLKIYIFNICIWSVYIVHCTVQLWIRIGSNQIMWLLWHAIFIFNSSSDFLLFLICQYKFIINKNDLDCGSAQSHQSSQSVDMIKSSGAKESKAILYNILPKHHIYIAIESQFIR